MLSEIHTVTRYTELSRIIYEGGTSFNLKLPVSKIIHRTYISPVTGVLGYGKVEFMTNLTHSSQLYFPAAKLRMNCPFEITDLTGDGRPSFSTPVFLSEEGVLSGLSVAEGVESIPEWADTFLPGTQLLMFTFPELFTYFWYSRDGTITQIDMCSITEWLKGFSEKHGFCVYYPWSDPHFKKLLMQNPNVMLSPDLLALFKVGTLGNFNFHPPL
jgi:hypothetical protein